jgi:threonine dehydratase
MAAFFRKSPPPPSVDVTFAKIKEAQSRTSHELEPTPLTYSPTISALVGKHVSFKWENKFPTGSFKERGALNFLKSLSPEERKRGVCAASAGNHALALSHHAQRLQIPCTIVMPRTAALVKVDSTRSAGASVQLEGVDFDAAYRNALALSEKNNQIFVPAFDDVRTVCGQGTCGLEVLEQHSDFDTIVVSIGGGGLMAGIATVIKEKRPEVTVIGVQSEWAVEERSKAHQKAPAFPPGTIADGIAVKRVGTLTAPILKEKVDQIISVTEADIAQSIITYLRMEKTVVEGAGAAALVPVLGGQIPESSEKIVVVVSGSNIDVNLLSRLIDRDMRKRGRLLRLRVSVPDRPGSLAVVTSLISEKGANVLETFHDRSFSLYPSNVDITFLLELRNEDHQQELRHALHEAGVSTEVI